MTSTQANRRLSMRLAVTRSACSGLRLRAGAVLLTNQICVALGVNSLTQRDSVSNTQVDASRTVTIELDQQTPRPALELPAAGQSRAGSTPASWPRWSTRSSTQKSAPVTGQAVPSYGPQFAGEYFKKLECFCFTQQSAGARRERGDMPVTFVVDPKLPGDVNTIHAFLHLLRGRGPRGQVVMEGGQSRAPPASSASGAGPDGRESAAQPGARDHPSRWFRRAFHTDPGHDRALLTG